MNTRSENNLFNPHPSLSKIEKIKKLIKEDKIDWTVALFLILTPIAALILLPLWIIYSGWSWSIFAFALVFAGLTNLSVTAGYHRLFSHRSYDAHPLVKIFFLLIGASAFQGSALKWSSDHRIHHSEVDTDEDPYSIKKGFFYAHMGWLFLKEAVDRPVFAPDLEKDKWIRLQHHYFVPLAIAMGFWFPTIVGYWLGSAFGGFVLGGVVRIVLTQHSTFFVNSLSHTLGKQTYSKDISARDSIIVAILTHGEGYHNFHHKFQIDYRNGIKWYHWDPTKWTILILKWTGLAKKLRTISAQEILRARIQVEEFRLRSSGLPSERLEAIKSRILETQQKLKQLKADYSALKLQLTQDYENRKRQVTEDYDLMKKQLQENTKKKLDSVRLEMELTQIEFQMALQQWRVYCQQVHA